MLHRLLLILIIIVVTSTWWVDENFRLTSMQVIAASCTKLAIISNIKDGSVQLKKPSGVFQAVGIGTPLCYGDFLKTISKTGKTSKSRLTALILHCVTGVCLVTA